MNNLDKQYQALLQDILDNGVKKEDRTGTGTLSVFGRQIRHKMSDGFPLLTTKKMAWKSIVTELIWFLRGDTNIKYLVDNDCHIWDGDAYKNYLKQQEKEYEKVYKELSSNGLFEINLDWQNLSKSQFIDKIKADNEFAKKWGELGSIYGKQWRNWNAYKSEPQTGWLHKTEEGWVVKWSDLHSFSHGTIWSTTLIQDCDQHLFSDEDEDRMVKFEHITLGYNETNFEPNQIAKVGDYDYKYRGGVDQISNLIKDLKTNPDNRRLMVSAWNVGEIDKAVLPPCHYGFQVWTRDLTEREIIEYFYKHNRPNVKYQFRDDRAFYFSEDLNVWFEHSGSDIVLGMKPYCPNKAISLMWNQRSVDTFLGLPFNIASYGLLLEIIAEIVNMVPDELIGNLGDTHLYLNHIEQAKEQIGRESFELPKLRAYSEFWPTESGECGIPPFTNNIDFLIKELIIDDFQLEGYKSHPSIKAPLSN